VQTPPTYNLMCEDEFGKHLTVGLNLDNITDRFYIIAISGPAYMSTAPPFQAYFHVRLAY
jgi:hypothetical protein